jgi:hypothetical protein
MSLLTSSFSFSRNITPKNVFFAVDRPQQMIRHEINNQPNLDVRKGKNFRTPRSDLPPQEQSIKHKFTALPRKSQEFLAAISEND